MRSQVTGGGLPIFVLDSKEVRRGSFTMDSYRSLIRYSIIRHIKALLLISCFLGRSFVFPYLPYILYKKLCKKSKKTATREPCDITGWRDVWDNPEGVLSQRGGRTSYGRWICFWMTVAMIVIDIWKQQAFLVEHDVFCHRNSFHHAASESFAVYASTLGGLITATASLPPS